MVRSVFKKIIGRYNFNPKKNLIFDKYKFKSYKFIFLGDNVRVMNDFTFANTHNLEIRDNVFIGARSYIDAVALIRIEEGTMIGPRFTCISANHYYDAEDLEAIPFDDRLILKPVIIGKNVWISACVSVLPGVNIGEGAVIGMGVIVNKNIPPYSVVVGNPMRIIKYRDVDRYNELKKLGKIYNEIYAGKGFKYI